MIKSWTLEHFKSVYERTTLEFAPLTIFAGANSSGKSTLIQSLLLTTQTLQNTVYSRPVILNGHIVRLGAFDDIASNSHENDLVKIGFELVPFGIESTSRPFYPRTYYPIPQSRQLSSVSSFECYFTFSARGSDLGREIRQLQPIVEECSVKAHSIEAGKTHEDEVLLKRTQKTGRERILAHFNVPDSQIETLEPALFEYELVKPTVFKPPTRSYYGVVPKTGKPIGVSLEHFLPGRVQLLYNTVEEQKEVLRSVLMTGEATLLNDIDVNFEQEDFNDFRTIVIAILEELYTDLTTDADLATTNKVSSFGTANLGHNITALKATFTKEQLRRVLTLPYPPIRRLISQRFSDKPTEVIKAIRGKRMADYNIAFSQLPDLPGIGVAQIRAFFSRTVKYLGPLRDEPKPVYPLAGAVDPKDIGFRGENTAAVLEVHRNTTVSYVPSANVDGTPEESVIEGSLADAVLDWLEYLGVASDVRTFDKGKLGHELKVAAYRGDDLHDLTHVGVGVSQVLPILVLSLLAEVGSTLIFEQPELHLHPRVQTRLADFFVSMRMLHKQCIVETHSEYLINRLRYRATVSEGNTVSNNVIMYFVEKELGHSTYRPIRINRFGVIEDWPKGFFDENEENAAEILRAAMEKRKRENKT
jgi:predicted ATPase